MMPPELSHRVRVQYVEKERLPHVHRVAAVDELRLNQALDWRLGLIDSVVERRPDGWTEDVDPVKDTFSIGAHPDFRQEALQCTTLSAHTWTLNDQ